MAQEPTGYWEDYEKATQEESGGGGGIICQALIETGFKVYAKGLSQEETFFPAPVRDKPARKAAKAQAAALAAQHGANRPQWSIQIRIPLATAFRQFNGVWGAATWNDDRFFVVNGWTDAAKEVVQPSLAEHGIIPGNLVWCRISFKEDPYSVSLGEAGMTEKDADDNPRFPLVAYVSEVFANEAAATAAMSGEDEEAAARPSVPTGWDFDNGESWAAVVGGLKASGPKPAVLARLNTMPAEDRAAEIGDATIADVEAWWDAV